MIAASAVPLAAADTGDVSFKLSPNINNWWVEVSTNAAPSSITASVDGGPAVPLKHEWWGGWGVSTHVPPGSHVIFTATVSGRTVTSTSYAWPDVPPASRGNIPGVGGFRTSSSSGSSYSFSQRIDIPPDNVIAALALANSGFFGRGQIDIGSIANIDRRATSDVYSRNSVSLDRQDALILLALGGNSGFYGTSSSPFLGGGYGSPLFGTSSLTQCLQERAIADRLGLGTTDRYVC